MYAATTQEQREQINDESQTKEEDHHQENTNEQSKERGEAPGDMRSDHA